MPGSRRRYWRLLRPLLGVLLIPGGLALPAAAAEPARALLERMNEAAEHLPYEGTLVHLQGADSSVLHIVRQLQDGHITERVSCEDAGRQIIRNDAAVTGIFPDQHAVLVEARDGRQQPRSPLPDRLPGPAGIDDALYLLSFAAPERIAGRDTQGIVIRPRDGFRYGYRLWLDRATFLPLKTQLVDERGHVLEQILFTRISVPAQVAAPPSAAVTSSAPAPPPAQGRNVPAGPPAAAAGDEWVVTQLPPGFRLAVRKARITPGTAGSLRQVVYSDGLATVSLFVEPAVAAAEQAEGLSQMGAANAYTTTLNGHMITAVGEVPVRTVEMFARSARIVDRPASSR